MCFKNAYIYIILQKIYLRRGGRKPAAARRESLFLAGVAAQVTWLAASEFQWWDTTRAHGQRRRASTECVRKDAVMCLLHLEFLKFAMHTPAHRKAAFVVLEDERARLSPDTDD